MTVYIAGKITGDPDYMLKFIEAQNKLVNMGHVVLSPAVLPEGFGYDAYIRMSRAMLDECEAVCLLPDWVDSDGAQGEYGRAVAKGKQVLWFDEMPWAVVAE